MMHQQQPQQLQPVVFSGGRGGFDHHSGRYKCCCNGCHVKTGALIVGILALIFGVLSFIYGIHKLASPLPLQHFESSANTSRADRESNEDMKEKMSQVYYGVSAVSTVWGLIDLTCTVLLLIGIKKEKHTYLLPFLVVEIINIILVILLGALIAMMLIVWGGYFVAFLSSSSSGFSNQRSEEERAAIAGGVGMMLVLVVTVLFLSIVVALVVIIWFFIVILNCYRYLKEKSLFDAGTAVTYAPQDHKLNYGQGAPAPPPYTNYPPKSY